MGQSERKVDIIIPVYNAFEDLKACTESVKKWTNLEKHRLIFIDDNSTDERIGGYLESLKQEHILVLRNRSNLGFSRNVNIGMKQSAANDVLLLNSDTVVTKHWLEKLAACAYSSRTTATVTPLSNNATLCSVPVFCRENTIPDGYSLDGYAQLVERCSRRIYPEIPVANGFCMYIKRAVIRRIGMFDAEAFEKGYGEENDFCFRAAAVGWKHVMCDDTYIFHSGTRSFDSLEKRKNMEKHEKILEARYPEQMQKVRVHCRDHPNAVVWENIRLWTILSGRRQRQVILYLLQADFREEAADHTGGTQLHVKDLTEGLRGQYDIVTVARNGACLNVTLYMEAKELAFVYSAGQNQQPEQLYSEPMAMLYRRILEAFCPCLVHIHHTKGMTLELFYEAEKRNIPIAVTIHDYHFLCPNEKLLDHTMRSCDACTNEAHCRICLKKRYGIDETVPYLSVWREAHEKALKKAQRIFVPSESARGIVLSRYGGVRDKIKVIEHGTEQVYAQRAVIKKQGRPFRVAFLGGISTAKGYRQAVAMIRKSSRNIHWYLFGSFECRQELLEKRRNFTNVGIYRREELPRLLKTYDIDLVCILSIWQETFCYTLSEAAGAGVPVLVTKIGALGERVRRMGCGWTVPVQSSAAQILARIEQIRSDSMDYEKKQKNARQARLLSAEEMCRMYEAEYQPYLSTCQCRDIPDLQTGEWLLEGLDSTGQGIRLLEAQNRLSEIENSYTYRLVRKIARLKLPFKSSIKAALRMAYRRIRK
ncbi:MAG: glycosyltransferase [Eubacterium sp.]|nr:glycosyltransferase [Eubacterium sp.]